jgi:hypothetical protein
MIDLDQRRRERSFGLYIEAFDALHPDDWPNNVQRPRQVYVGIGSTCDDEELTMLSVTQNGKRAAVLLNVEDLRAVIGQLSANLSMMESP